MATIETFLAQMVEHNAQRVILTAGQPSELMTSDGQSRSGPTLSEEKLVDAMCEIAPADQQFQFFQEGTFSFSHECPANGDFDVVFQRHNSLIRASITRADAGSATVATMPQPKPSPRQAPTPPATGLSAASPKPAVAQAEPNATSSTTSALSSAIKWVVFLAIVIFGYVERVPAEVAFNEYLVKAYINNQLHARGAVVRSDEVDLTSTGSGSYTGTTYFSDGTRATVDAYNDKDGNLIWRYGQPVR